MAAQTKTRISLQQVYNAIPQEVLQQLHQQGLVTDSFIKLQAKSNTPLLVVSKDKPTSNSRKGLDIFYNGRKIVNPFTRKDNHYPESQFKIDCSKKDGIPRAQDFKAANKTLNDKDLYVLYKQTYATEIEAEYQEQLLHWKTESLKQCPPGYTFNDETGKLNKIKPPKKSKSTPPPTPIAQDGNESDS